MKLTKTMPSLALAFTVGLTGVATTATTLSPVNTIEAKAATTIAYKAKLYVNSSDGTLNMRKSASATSAKVQTLKQGKQVNISKKKVVGGTTWLYGTASGKKGWMNAKYLSTKKITQVSNSLDSTISYGARFLGTPYVWGGTTPSGFDCSGFTSYVYRNAIGKSIPRTSGAQYAASKKISKSQLQVGDLVFFNTSGGGVSHVSIYAGNNKLLHAAGKSVKYSNLYDGYWNKRIVGYGTFR
ncbi:C40 family peptidase [Kurthia huakuii]|uniref:C40 family peptidase n=1 Tax=Kurthia huakuii TaxID=1421019 RepID=UPI000495086B|nr:SH3 domain-containing C40 family peptidase [Kurthia huakuii]MBM7699048.1 peptidoglycan endopeptidase LytE [Kurthia huakuii]